MALLDFLKRKKEIEKARVKPPVRLGGEKKAPNSEKNTEKVSDVKKVEKRKSVHPVKSSEAGVLPKAKQFNKVKDFSFEIVKEPHISEKASILSEINQYVFKVSPRSNKQEVKKSVEGIYGVNVLSVNMIKIPPKKRRLGKTEGFRKRYQKAIITIKKGQKIEIL